LSAWLSRDAAKEPGGTTTWRRIPVARGLELHVDTDHPLARVGPDEAGGAEGVRQAPAKLFPPSPASRHSLPSGGPMWGLVIVLIVVALWVIAAYNGLISLKNQTLNAFKQIDVQLKRRHDLIPNLVNAVKGAMDFEKGTLEAVIQARNQAVKINAQGAGPEA